MRSLGCHVQLVKTPNDLEGLDGIVIPGGESTTISMLLESSKTYEPLSKLLSEGMPVLGTCAGMILLADTVLDGRADQKSFDQIELTVRRNGFGRQIASFERDLIVEGLEEPFPGVFIRAPLAERVGPNVQVLSTIESPDGEGTPVLCRQRNVLVSSFHPELTNDTRIHRIFVDSII